MIAGDAATRTALNRGLAVIATAPSAWSTNWKRRENRFLNHSVAR